MIGKKFQEINKDYYRYVEDYDWVDVTDNLRGLESFFHKFRERKVKGLIKKYKQGDNFLDAGCGTGLILRHLPRGSFGIDINPRNIAKAKKYLPFHNVILGDIEKLPFKDSEFTTIVATEILEHLPNPKIAVNELKRVLKNGGILIGSVPAKSPIWSLRFLSSTCPIGEPYHKNYSKNNLIALLRQFNIITIGRIVFGMNLIFVVKKP